MTRKKSSILGEKSEKSKNPKKAKSSCPPRGQPRVVESVSYINEEEKRRKTAEI